MPPAPPPRALRPPARRGAPAAGLRSPSRRLRGGRGWADGQRLSGSPGAGAQPARAGLRPGAGLQRAAAPAPAPRSPPRRRAQESARRARPLSRASLRLRRPRCRGSRWGGTREASSPPLPGLPRSARPAGMRRATLRPKWAPSRPSGHSPAPRTHTHPEVFGTGGFPQEVQLKEPW